MMFQRSSSRSSITTSSLRERSEVLLDLAKRIAYLHSRRILHRDLKPCNIGFDHDGVLNLFDFDVSRLVPFCNNPNKEVFWLTRRVGSPRYMSPEMAQGISIWKRMCTAFACCVTNCCLSKSLTEICLRTNMLCVHPLLFPRRIGRNRFCNVWNIVGPSRFPNVRRWKGTLLIDPCVF